jgi:hypothetical protein
MPFYIVLSNEEKINDIVGKSKTVPLKLKKHLFIANRIDENFQEKINGEDRILILKTSRNVERAEIDYESNVFNLGSLILLAYEPLEDANANRVIYRLIERSPCFKASSLIYLFPYINYDKYIERRIVSPSMIIRKIITYGGRAISASRLKLIYPSDGKPLIEDLERNLMKRLEKIGDAIQKHKMQEKTVKMKTLLEMRSEIKIIRNLAKVYHEELKINLKTIESKIINIAKTVNQMIEETRDGENSI